MLTDLRRKILKKEQNIIRKHLEVEGAAKILKTQDVKGKILQRSLCKSGQILRFFMCKFQNRWANFKIGNTNWFFRSFIQSKCFVRGCIKKYGFQVTFQYNFELNATSLEWNTAMWKIFGWFWANFKIVYPIYLINY